MLPVTSSLATGLAIPDELRDSLGKLVGVPTAPPQASASPAVDSSQLMVTQMTAWLQGVQAALSLMPALMQKQPNTVVATAPAPQPPPPLPPSLVQLSTLSQRTDHASRETPADLRVLKNRTQVHNTSSSSEADAVSPLPASEGRAICSPSADVPFYAARRFKANARERNRVHTISAAFDSLRNLVPCYMNSQKMSKLAVLRIACVYIEALSACLNEEDSPSDSASPAAPAATSSPVKNPDKREKPAAEPMEEDAPEDLSVKKRPKLDDDVPPVPKPQRATEKALHDAKLPRMMPKLSYAQCIEQLRATINHECKTSRRI